LKGPSWGGEARVEEAREEEAREEEARVGEPKWWLCGKLRTLHKSAIAKWEGKAGSETNMMLRDSVLGAFRRSRPF